MKNNLILFITLIALGSCSPENKNKDQHAKTTEPANDSLRPDQLDSIKRIHKAFEEVYPISFKETLENFKKDPDIDTEIGVWLNMVNAYESYLHTKEPQPALEAKKEIFALILNRSMMPAEEAIKSVQPKILTEKEAKTVMSCYQAEPVPMDTIK